MLIKISKVVDKNIKRSLLTKISILTKKSILTKVSMLMKISILRYFFTQLAFPLLGEVPLELQGEGFKGGQAGLSI